MDITMACDVTYHFSVFFPTKAMRIIKINIRYYVGNTAPGSECTLIFRDRSIEARAVLVLFMVRTFLHKKIFPKLKIMSEFQ